MIDNITGPDPMEASREDREFAVTITVTLTKTITSSNAKIDDDIERMEARIHGLLGTQAGYAVEITQAEAEPK